MSSAEFSWALDQSPGTPLKKLILIVLGDVCHPGSPVRADPTWLAQRCDASALETIEALAQLRAEGFLRVDHDGDVWLNMS